MKLYILFCVSIKLVFSFNVDTDNIISFRGDNGTLFGYSAVLLNNSDGNWVVVGAPKANFSDGPEITMPGNVYKCKVDFTRFQQEDCVPIPLRPTDVNRWPDLPGYEEDNQLLGASMAHLQNKIVICAPLWKSLIPLKFYNQTHPHGRCHNLDITLNRSNTRKYNIQKFPSNDYEFAEAGFSISSKELFQYSGTRSLLLGAPGFYDSKGGFLTYSYEQGYNLQSYTHLDISTDFKNVISNGTLMGYSIATGNISPRHSCPNVVVLGAPRFKTNEGILGAVLLICMYVNTMDVKKHVFGTEQGSGFGSAIVFDDINNDGLDDLMVGAPLQSRTVIDSGAVHVFLGNSEDILITSRQVLEGVKLESSRFGTALVCVGDLNKDGYKDLVVGAPYEDNLSGAIYIYHGGPKQLTLVQVIHAADVDTRPVSFGWFISSPLDIDQNNYPDFAVGSYMSDTVSILRSRPIIKLSFTIKIDPPMIPLNSSGQECRDDNFRPCANVEVCLNFSGVDVPEKILVSYTINADTLRTNAMPSKPSRVSMYVKSKNHTFTRIEENIEIRKGDKTCRDLNIIVPIATREFFIGLEDELRFEASFDLSKQQIPGRLQPILDNKPKIGTASATFLSGCNGSCHPNLKLEVSFEPNQIIFGSTTELVVKIRVTNHDEPSHGTRITIITTNNTSYLSYYQPQGQLTEVVSCGEEFDHNNASDLNCDLSRTLYQQQQGLFNLRFNVSQELLTLENSDLFRVNRNVGFIIKASSAVSDTDSSDNVVQVQVSVKFVSELQLHGVSIPNQFTISESGNKPLNIVHKYYLLNRGPSPIYNGTLLICIPVKNIQGTLMMQKDDLKVITNSSNLKWRLVQFEGESVYSSSKRRSSTSTTSIFPKSKPFSEETADQFIQKKENETAKKTFQEISCSNIRKDGNAIIEMYIIVLEQDHTESFDIAVTISEKTLNFENVSGIVYISTAEVKRHCDNRYETIGSNASFDISSEIFSKNIFPKEVLLVAKTINIWIIIGGCIGGVMSLLVLNAILWKCGFFERKKKYDIQKWKKQSSYYARRQWARAGYAKDYETPI